MQRAASATATTSCHFCCCRALQLLQVFLYNGIAIFWFTVNTLVPLLRGGAGGAAGVDTGRPALTKMQKSQRNYLAVIAALLQVAIMWWLGDAR